MAIARQQLIYKLDSNGGVRYWCAEVDGARYRFASGRVEGKEVVSGWKTAKAKNVGKSNATTAEQQALLDVSYCYADKRKTGGYADTPEESGVKYVEPMLAEKWKDYGAKMGFPLWCQPKLDGIRCVASVNGLHSREGERITSCQHIERALAPVFKDAPWLIFDGELYSHSLKANFNKIQSSVTSESLTISERAEVEKTIQYHVYDLIVAGRCDLPEFDLSAAVPDETRVFADRIFFLLSVIPLGSRQPIKFVDTHKVDTQEQFDEFHDVWIMNGYEGSMARSNTPYLRGRRSKGLLKRKEFIDGEFPILRVEEGEGNWAGKAKRIVCSMPNGDEFGATPKGTMPEMAKVFEERADYAGGFITARYQNLTPDGVPRMAIAHALYKKGAKKQ